MSPANQWKSMFGLLWLALSELYRHWRHPRKVQSLPIVVVGSLRSGGGGKTPTVSWLAEHLPEAAVLVHPTPDEEILLRDQFGDRVFAESAFPRAWERAQHAGFPFAICDGGFQDPRLLGAVKLLLWNALPPHSLSDLLPCGPFRELALAATRADRTLVRQGLPPPSKCATISDYHWDLRLPKGMQAGPCLLACGVGDPEGVRKDLEILGCEIVGEHVVGDHRPFSPRTIQRLSQTFPGIPWIGTAKDRPRWPAQAPELRILERDWAPQHPEALLAWIRQELSARSPAITSEKE